MTEATLETYFQDYPHGCGRQGLPRGRGATLLRKVVPPDLRDRGKLAATKALRPVSRRRAQALAGDGPLPLHLGSGTHRLEGWVNVDIVGMSPDLHWDLRWPLPFPDASADRIFLEHVLEHFAGRDGMVMLAECRRVLAPGGIIRVAVPDLGKYAHSYCNGGTFIEQARPGRPTRMVAMSEVLLGHGHRSGWDAETLVRCLEESGFVDCRERAYLDTDLDTPPDNPARELESVYAEARGA